jgi:hypothetical protein
LKKKEQQEQVSRSRIAGTEIRNIRMKEQIIMNRIGNTWSGTYMQEQVRRNTQAGR